MKLKVVHDGFCNDVLIEFAAHCGEADRPVVGCFGMIALLKHRGYVGLLPLVWDGASVDGILEHAGEYGGELS